MVNMTRRGERGELIILTADPPEQVRFRHPNGSFLPNREGRTVGTGNSAWTIDNTLGLSLRFQRLEAGAWVDAGIG